MVMGAVTSEELQVLRLWTSEVDTRLRRFDYQHYVARAHSVGDRSGRLLAWHVRGEQQRRPIGGIKLDSGTMTNIQAGINDAFQRYYSILHAAQQPPSTEQLTEFFHALPLTRLSAAQQSELDKPIDAEEVQIALQQLAGNKAVVMVSQQSTTAHARGN
ncbi:hypothetical protein NDU88_005286 [Pleurodeles waltl]|uniref:Uncharacterized protein n=1 Tax=Pleurodeles waltl TaxID=8319 RepID=A0AAV7UHM4_PLEWA|nr:hypothetical protein NDU88_005286 [Pleurodeles waltl]